MTAAKNRVNEAYMIAEFGVGVSECGERVLEGWLSKDGGYK